MEYIEEGGVKYKVLGIPDSYELGDDLETANFVDFKSGKENTWDDAKLAADLKMKTTAWLVWRDCAKPAKVVGYIEYIPTTWNPLTREVEHTGGESTVAGKVQYTAEEMLAFEAVIVKTMKEVNAGYIEWLNSTDEFLNQDDIAEYAELERQIGELDKRADVVMARIAEQMKFGGKSTISTLFGTFYFTKRKKWAYPGTLKINYLDMGITLEDADKIDAAVSAAKKRFDTENEPASISESLSFKPKK